MYNQTILRTTEVLMKSTGDTVSSLLTYCHWYAVFLRTKWFSHLNPGIDSFLVRHSFLIILWNIRINLSRVTIFFTDGCYLFLFWRRIFQDWILWSSWALFQPFKFPIILSCALYVKMLDSTSQGMKNGQHTRHGTS